MLLTPKLKYISFQLYNVLLPHFYFTNLLFFFSVSFFLSRMKAQGGQGSYSLLHILRREWFLNYRGLLHCRQILYHLSHQGSQIYFVIKNISIFCKISRHMIKVNTFSKECKLLTLSFDI